MERHNPHSNTGKSITSEMLAYTADYLRLRTIRNSLAPIIEGIHKKTLQDHKWGAASVDQLSDSELVTFRKLVNEQQKKIGLETKDPMVCPLLKVEELQRNARVKFINAFTPITGVSTTQIFCNKDALTNLAKIEEVLLTQVKGMKEFKVKSAMTTHFIESVRKEITGYGRTPYDLAKVMATGNEQAANQQNKHVNSLKRSA